MNPGDTPRVNQNGHRCPSWCITDHGPRDDGLDPFEFHGGHTRATAVGSTPVGARAVEDGSGRGRPSILAGAMIGPGSLWLSPFDADQLAQLVDLLAGATPDQHRDVAEAIRAVARTVQDNPLPDPPSPRGAPA